MSYKSESKTDSGAGDPQFTGRNQPYRGARIQLTFKKSKQKNVRRSDLSALAALFKQRLLMQ